MPRASDVIPREIPDGIPMEIFDRIHVVIPVRISEETSYGSPGGTPDELSRKILLESLEELVL